jgi:protein-tyrosine-phosphatase
VLAVMNEIGIDMSANIRKQLTPGMVTVADRVFVMNDDATVPHYLRDSAKAQFWPVIDPFLLSRDATREIRDRISTLVAGLKLE